MYHIKLNNFELLEVPKMFVQGNDINSIKMFTKTPDTYRRYFKKIMKFNGWLKL